jgi:hypothetical protein
VLSYAEQLNFTAVADRAAMADLPVFREGPAPHPFRLAEVRT